MNVLPATVNRTLFAVHVLSAAWAIPLTAEAVVIATSNGMGADAEVRESSPTTNRGSSTELGARIIDNFPMGHVNDGSDRFSAMYLKFDITDLTTLPNPTTSVRLTFRNTNLTPNRIHDTTPPGNNIDYRTGIAFYGLDRDHAGNNWDESTITYLNAPGMSFDFNVGTKDFDFVDPDGAGPLRPPLTPLGVAPFPAVPPQNHLPVGGELVFSSDRLNDFVTLSLNAGQPTVTIVAALVHDGKVPIDDWKNFNYLFNPKEQTTLSVDADYDADVLDPNNPLGSPWSGASNATDANGFSPFSPQLILTPNFPIVYEGFDYSPPGSDLLGANGGDSFAGPWGPLSTLANSNYDIADGSLSFPGLATSDSRVTTAAIGTELAGISRPLSTPIGQPTTTQYVSFLIRPEGILNQGAFNGFFGLALEGAAFLFVGKSGVGALDQFVLEDDVSQSASGTTIEVGEEYLLVLRADFTSGNDLFTLYVNPMPGADEPLSGTVKNDVDVGIIDKLLLYSTGAFSIDEIRIGPNYADVVPPLLLPGDYNEDGIVDAADYTVWRDRLGSSASLPNDDTPGVAADDYTRWVTNFGMTVGSGSSATGSAAAVPEPSHLGMWLAAAILGWNDRYRRVGRSVRLFR